MRRSVFSISRILTVTCILYGLYTPIELVDAQDPRRQLPPTTQGQPASAAAEELNKLIVMIRCQIADDESFGAGIIFGKGSNRLYIATANHVVRRNTDEAKNVKVQLKWLPGEWKTAELLDSTNRDLDLAVLAIDLSRDSVSADALDWNQLGDPGLLRSGDSVFSVGYPNGVGWRTFEIPNKIYKKTGASIIFETVNTAPGNSGGALLNEKREIVGMIREVDSSDGKAVGIQSVIETLKEWTYPVNLKLRSAGGSKTTDATQDKPSEPNSIYNFRARDLSRLELEVTVDYQHAAGESPTDRVTLRASVVGNDGSPSPIGEFSAASQAVKVGGGSATLTIRRETRKPFTSAIVRMSMVKEPRSVLVSQDFPYSKVWGASTTREGDEPVLRLGKSSFVLPDDGMSSSPRDTELLPGSCCRVVRIGGSNRTTVGRIYLWDSSKDRDPDSHVSLGYQLQLWALQDLTNPNSEFVSKYYNAFAGRKPMGTEESVELGGLRFLFRLLAARHVPQRGETLVYLNSVRIQVEVSPIPSNQMKRP